MCVEYQAISLKNHPMKKTILFAAILLIFSHSLFAQLRIALAGGGHSSTIIETNDLPGWAEMKKNYSGRTGAHFGFIADLQLGLKSKFYFQPGVMFYNKGRKFYGTYDTAQYNYFSIDKKQLINYVDLPLNLVYKMPLSGKTKLFIGGGPYLSFFYNGSEKTETYMKSGQFVTDENADLPVGDGPDKYKTLDVGVNATAGVEFGGFFIAGNFSRSLTDMYNAKDYTGNFKNQVVGATLGIFIGKPVSLDDRPKDTDGDGIVDNEDSCVTEPGPLVTKGCPDTDGDGIADRNDKCPNEKGLASNFGCPIRDTDGDGIPDDKDKCITVPGLAKYDGCPIPDTDNDGINDEEDKCPAVPGLARYGGCPIPDTDGDGVNDEIDRCITEPGAKENNGCPEIKQEIIKKVEFAARKIQFKYSKSDLLPESETILDEVAKILLDQPELKIDIEGHTSNEGNFDANMKLSEQRADRVKIYLISKGIDASRLTSKGYGPTKRLNEGKTEQERALNRRVELKLRNN